MRPAAVLRAVCCVLRGFTRTRAARRARHGAFAIAALLVAASAFAGERPVIVVISLDQFRADYLERFAPYFGARGFRRLAAEGAVFTNARQRHAVTSTAPGHAAIGGGTVPAENGIIANRWFERDAPVDAQRWKAYFDEIAAYRKPGTAASPLDADGWWTRGGSPRLAAATDPLALDGGSLSDAIDAHVVSIALTDRAAILMGGRGADAAYWFDGPSSRFVSSAYYRANPETLAFNSLVPGYMPASTQWKPWKRVADSVVFDPPAAWPLKNQAYGGTFPHVIPTLRALQYTPFAHDMLFDFALHVVSVEHPDVLFVGISSTDYIGHLYGPDSLEVADSAVRLDRALGDFVDALQRRFGDRLVVVLTSDHGVQSMPEIAKLRDPGADTGRIDFRIPDAGAKAIRDLPADRVHVERELAAALGLPFSESAPLRDALVYFFEEPSLYLNWPRIRELQLDGEKVKSALRGVVRRMDGVSGAWTSSEPLPPLLQNSFRADRSGDVLIALRPGWIWMWGSNSTTHGQAVEADLRVPLIFWGDGVKPGTYDGDASPLDIVPTVGTLFGVRVGGRASHVLPCLKPDAAANPHPSQ